MMWISLPAFSLPLVPKDKDFDYHMYFGRKLRERRQLSARVPPYHGYIVQYTLLLYQWERLVATLAMTLGLEHFSIYRSESRRFFFRRAEEGEEIRSGVLLY